MRGQQPILRIVSRPVSLACAGSRRDSGVNAQSWPPGAGHAEQQELSCRLERVRTVVSSARALTLRQSRPLGVLRRLYVWLGVVLSTS